MEITDLAFDQALNLMHYLADTPDTGFVSLGPVSTPQESPEHAGFPQAFTAYPLETVKYTGKTGAAAAAPLLALENKLTTLGFESHPDHPFTGGIIGCIAYEFGATQEKPLHHLTGTAGIPDVHAGLYSWVVVMDTTQHRAQLVVQTATPEALKRRLYQHLSVPQPEPPALRMLTPFEPALGKQECLDRVSRVREYIAAGDCYQVNISQPFHARYEGPLWQAYRSVCRRLQAPFSAFFQLDRGAVLSFSPERFLQTHQGEVETRPIKGTRARGTTPAEDQRLARELCDSRKDQAENLMIVDLLRNDLGRFCVTGSIRVPELFKLESFANVHHLVSTVTGKLRPDVSPMALLIGTFPGGSITGAPKIRAMEVIAELETTSRGPYCGSVFYLTADGHLDSSIAIRSVLASEGRLTCWGGGGIVADSEPEAEYDESITKVRAIMEALEQA
ncbi:aminodeoxychorismate synthase component I [Marinobacter sp. X15-166B]|uniref:aminodeoxychorismate synthase component I n=1 Tax=Marinobacter sp. X15-166B TaxID=1897620 RepID=UPI00085C6D9B|nr:aminodeoxychorismate synthase component I [Marinobacter sp. X15-166B]OEY67721.1 aminodeoxychorismate synthase, component I [Marinobacter sp. X15-166B]